MTTIDSTDRVLDFGVNDADQHSTPPMDAYERYIDPSKRDKAIRLGPGPDGRPTMLYAGRPPRLRPSKGQVTFQDEDMSDMGIRANGVDDEGFRVPGSLLGKLNPLKGLDEDGRKEFARRYRALQAQLDDPVSRLTVMDELGVDAVVNYMAPLGIEYEFEDDFDALYANLRAINRYIATEWGFHHADRLFTPPLVSFADADAAIAELDYLLAEGPPKVIQIPTGHSMFTSPFRPELDPFWARVDEAGINICTHLASLTFYGRQSTQWSEPEVMLGDMDAFQYAFFYGDRPAMETVGAAILQGLFNRFPNVKLLISEQGSLWVPYLVKIMDNTFFMGRKATWGALERRPSEYFKEHVLVAPWPEENVGRVTSVVGTDPIVFGSDFPHGNGLPDPAMYLPQLEGCTNDQARAIMRGNLGRFLGLQD
jgi:predicted TIM-barrel fold metal-dependent hydrolase